MMIDVTLVFSCAVPLIISSIISKKKLSSFWRTPYLVTKLRIKSDHFSANANQSYLTPMTTFHHPKGMQLFNVVHISSKDWDDGNDVTHWCARWQMMANGVIQGSARRRQLTQLVRLGVKSDASLHRSVMKSGHVCTCLGNTWFHGWCILKLLWYIWYFKYPS